METNKLKYFLLAALFLLAFLFEYVRHVMLGHETIGSIIPPLIFYGAIVVPLVLWTFSRLERLGAKLKEYSLQLEQSLEGVTGAREYLQNLVDSIEEGVVTVGRDYIITDANPAACRMIGRGRGEIIGKRCYEVNHSEKTPCKPEQRVCPLRDVTASRKPLRLMHEHFNRGGKKLYVEIHAFPVIENEEVAQMVEIWNDATEKVLLERETELLQKVDNLLHAGADQKEIFETITHGLTSAFGYKLSAIYLLSEDRSKLVCRGYSTDSEIVKKAEKLTGMKALNYALPLHEGSMLSKVVETKKPVITSDIEALIEEHIDRKEIKLLAKPLAKIVGVKYGIGVPMLAGDKLVGTIGVGSAEELTNKDAERLARFGRQAGSSVEKAALYEELEGYAEILEINSAKLSEYAIEIKKVNELKDLFTDIIRHDLMNPIGIIKNLAEFWAEEESLKGLQDEIEVLKRNVRKLEEIIESASKLAKIESMEKIEFQRHDLNAILKKVIDSFGHVFKEKGMQVEYSAKGEYPARVNLIIEEVFLNLISNAIKYSPEKSRIVVGIEDANDSWRVMVKDYGEGVPDEYKEAIFERFKRADRMGVKGTGLGLAIVKQIVELHRGRVWVEDNPEGGSIFYVTIPKISPSLAMSNAEIFIGKLEGGK